MENFTIELLVSNHFGVLNRITGLYAKRGYNIESLVVHPTTEDRSVSRMSIESLGDERVQTQMIRQLSKLYDVKQVVLVKK